MGLRTGRPYSPFNTPVGKPVPHVATGLRVGEWLIANGEWLIGGGAGGIGDLRFENGPEPRAGLPVAFVVGTAGGTDMFQLTRKEIRRIER